MLNFEPLVIRSQLIYEYQEGKAEVTLKCLNGEVQVHEYVLGFYSNAFNLFLKKARERSTDGSLYIDFKNYSVEVVRLCMDMLYAVNKKDLGTNDILQLMSFLIDAGHYGEDYPWHTKTVDSLAESLIPLTKSMKKDALIELSLVLTKLRPFDDTGFDKTIKALQRGVTREDVMKSCGEMMFKTDMFTNINNEYEWVSEEGASIGLIGRYLKDAGIEINQTSFLTEIQRLVQLLMTISPPCKKDDKISRTSYKGFSYTADSFMSYKYVPTSKDPNVQAIIDARIKAKAVRKLNGDAAG